MARNGSVRVGTRASALSMWQGRWVATRLTGMLPDRTLEIVTIATKGDTYTGPFAQLTETGLFTSALEAALEEGSVDLVVHSLKDLPVSGEVLPVTAVPLRGDPRDALVSREGLTLSTLPGGSRIGTSSPRRACLIGSQRPDVEIVSIRGNVDTRVRLLDEGGYDAVVLAAAGLERLGLENRISEWMDPREFPPAPGQGALAVQVRGDDPELTEAVSGIDDPEARETTSAERYCLEALGGGCARPVGAYGWRVQGALNVAAFVGSPDGATILRSEATGTTAETVGRAAAESLLRDGARELLR